MKTLFKIIFSVIVIGGIIWAHIPYDLECAKCYKGMNDGHQIRDKWLCNSCWGDLRDESEKIWDNAWDKSRIDWIYDNID